MERVEEPAGRHALPRRRLPSFSLPSSSLPPHTPSLSHRVDGEDDLGDVPEVAKDFADVGLSDPGRESGRANAVVQDWAGFRGHGGGFHGSGRCSATPAPAGRGGPGHGAGGRGVGHFFLLRYDARTRRRSPFVL
jgi:hypothetical protein